MVASTVLSMGSPLLNMCSESWVATDVADSKGTQRHAIPTSVGFAG